MSGIATYAFFGITSRSLGREDYASVSVLWSLMFAVGNGVMQPLEQEVARAVSERRAREVGAGPVIRLAVRIGGLFSLLLVLIALGLHGPLQERLFGDDPALLAAFVIGLVGFAAGHLARGTLSSHGRYRGYATFFGVDGIARVVFAGVLAALGVAVAGPYGFVLGLTPFVAVGFALFRQRGLLVEGPPARWQEISRALGWLLLGTGSLSLLIQGGTIAIELLASADQEDAAGVFLNGLQVARIPMFLFQAVLASLLPKLSHLAGQGRLDEFRGGLRRLVVAILGVGTVATLAAVVVGPTVVGVVFGSETVLGARDLGLLSASFIVIMAAICLDQAIIALSGHARMAVGWALALGVFVCVTALGEDLFLRVELGLAAGALFAFAWMAWFLRGLLRTHHPGRDLEFAEALAEVPIEP